MRRGFFFGVGATILLLLVGTGIMVTFGLVPANADAKPSGLEAWMARKSLHATLARQAPKGDNKVALTDENLMAGEKLYTQNCTVCHGGSDGAPSFIARGLYQEAPQLAKDGVEDDAPGVTYWKVAHGIRFTAMPSFDRTLTDEQIWQLTLFVSHMDKLPPTVEIAWQQAPGTPAAPAP